MKFQLSLAVSLATILFFGVSPAYASRICRSCAIRSQKVCTHQVQNVLQAAVVPAQVQAETQTTVINNLVGIPVPVNYSQPIQAQGSTVYGYSALTESYGQVDLGLLYNQAARLTDQAQQLAGQAAVDFSTLVQAEAQSRADVARIIAQGQAAKQALDAAGGYSTQQVQQRTFAFKVIQNSNGEVRIEELIDGSTAPKQADNQDQVYDSMVDDFKLSDAQNNGDGLSQLLVNKCANCHNNSISQGGLNLQQPISFEMQQEILERITTNDQDRLMPRNVDGTPGDKLSLEEVRLFTQAMGGGL